MEIGNLTRRTKTVTISEIEYVLKKLPLPIGDFLQNKFLQGKSSIVDQKTGKTSINFGDTVPSIADNREQVTLALENGVESSGLKDRNGDGIKWERSLIDTLINDYPDEAMQLYQQVLEFNGIRGGSFRSVL